MIQFFNLNEISEKEFTAINNENNTPYQNYGWLKILDEAAHRNPVKRLCVIYKIAVWSIDGEILAIAPVVFSRFGAKRKELMCWGYNMSTDYTDFLYSKGINESFVDSLINELLTVSGKERIFFSSVPECSITFKAIENMKATEILCKHTCVHIPLHQPSFDAFFNQLSKSTRQNIRTAYNRLKTDKLCAKLAVYENNQIDAELVDLLQRMYEKRREKLNAHKQTVRSKLVKQYRKFSLKKYSFMGEAMLHNPSSLVLVYYIDGKVAAFGHALRHSITDCPTFMQVCYNEIYKRYSPGVLMFIEYLKNNVVWNEKKYVDLALGEEQYKYDLGGVNHYTVSAKITKQ